MLKTADIHSYIDLNILENFTTKRKTIIQNNLKIYFLSTKQKP